MKRFVVISPELVYCPGAEVRTCTLDDLPQMIDPRGAVLFAIVPQAVGRVLATERTLDSVMPQQFPGANSFRAEPLETNVFQVYVATDELLTRLRGMAREVSVVPYPAAVRYVVNSLETSSEGPSLRERTRVFLASIATDLKKASAPERVAIDCLGEDYLITAMRGQEILAVRLVHGGEPAIELQRTLAGNRMEDPVVLTRDEDLALELKAQGFTADVADVGGDLIGQTGLDKILGLRFLTDIEVARERARETRRRGATMVAISLVVLIAAGVACGVFYGGLNRANTLNQRLNENQKARAAQLAALYQERYASLARKESVAVREELFDLSIALPPQVALVSLQKDSNGILAVVERRAGAAPFSRFDLISALAASPFFAKAKIKEEYEGHLVRYLLTVPTPSPDQPPTGGAAGQPQ